MLTHLQIRDFAIVEALELDFAAGLSAITGETGAGKSIMVDALGLLLGDRADAAVIRHGAERAEIAASFDLTGLPAARQWLAQQQLDDGHDCHLRRVLSSQGRSRCYINGSLQPLATLRELGLQLVESHSQHEHQSLLRREVQGQLLDDYGGQQALVAEVANLFQRWQQQERELAALAQADSEREARRELLHFQLNELEALSPVADEPAALAEEQRRLANAERLLDGSRRLSLAVYEDDEQSVYALLSRLEAELASLSGLDPQLRPILELLAGARIQLAEAGDALRHYGADLELEPDRLQSLEQRLDSYYTLARKHRCEPAELATVLSRLQQALDQLGQHEQQRERLAVASTRTHADWQTQAGVLSQRRHDAARDMGERVTAAMQDLGMPGGRLEVALEPLAKPGAQGLEAVIFMVSANPGQPLRELARVASGGELSRISLAIQVVAADSSHTPTLIFDEVDTGIGGAVAEVVGRQLRRLGQRRQVLCVTHLPQVAVQAHHHYRVSKQTSGQHTQTRVQRLTATERVEEIARMLGGVRLTARTRAHAREMLAQASDD